MADLQRNRNEACISPFLPTIRKFRFEFNKHRDKNEWIIMGRQYYLKIKAAESKKSLISSQTPYIIL